jgi:hypothetical protein
MSNPNYYIDLNKPFWIWDQNQHRAEDIRTKGDCCFNHIIGLPQKDSHNMPLLPYQRTLYEALQNHKYIWMKFWLLFGDFDDDLIVGGSGNNHLFGSNDVLKAGENPGANYFDCGDGLDTIIDFFNPERGGVTADNCEII